MIARILAMASVDMLAMRIDTLLLLIEASQ